MLEQELSHLPELKDVGLALIQYAKAQFSGLSFEANSQGRYVATPDNFVTFSVYWQRAKNITVTLRGNPDEFLPFEELSLKPDMAGYSSFKVTKVGQLAAAAFCIRRAAELYRAGRVRVQKSMKVIEK
ncbi:MAG: hypothetical protein FWG26_08130 [Betaproteobacteria bacterium]|nr:hypothetical protein [Betaproteobacteria bacterium]